MATRVDLAALRADAKRRSDQYAAGFRQSRHRLVHPDEELLLLDIVEAARNVIIVRHIGSGGRYRQCVQCGAMSLYADDEFQHHDNCPGVALAALLARIKAEGA